MNSEQREHLQKLVSKLIPDAKEKDAVYNEILEYTCDRFTAFMAMGVQTAIDEKYGRFVFLITAYPHTTSQIIIHIS